MGNALHEFVMIWSLTVPIFSRKFFPQCFITINFDGPKIFGRIFWFWLFRWRKICIVLVAMLSGQVSCSWCGWLVACLSFDTVTLSPLHAINKFQLLNVLRVKWYVLGNVHLCVWVNGNCDEYRTCTWSSIGTYLLKY